MLKQIATLGLFALLIAGISGMTDAQPSGYIYDEAAVPTYDLPDPLVMSNGKQVSNIRQWENKRRPEILQMFEEQMYGKMPGLPESMNFALKSEVTDVFGGKATRKQVTVYFTEDQTGPKMDIQIYLPNNFDAPAPLFVGLNFYGNQTIYPDAAIQITDQWVNNNDEFGIDNNTASDASRGERTKRWPVEALINRGYGLATIYYGDLDPDYSGDWSNGVHPLFYDAGQTQPAGDEWGAIGAWAWGLGRAMDYFETDGDINHEQVAVMGHSRLGKASLWAGAYDQRFAIVISNNSGCGGAALSKRQFGETVQRINTSFPHWFCDNFTRYNGKEDTLPFDQHMLVALVAPRPLYITSASKDLWADPRGEFLSGKHASPVYELYDQQGIGDLEMPDLNEPVMRTIGYHIRPGQHDVTLYDWERWMDFADKHFR